MAKSIAGRSAFLVRIAGPAMRDLVLAPERSPLTLGRHEHCDLHTPADEERISRFHAQFTTDGTRWYITDLKSTWGTYLNGYRLPPDQPHALSEGDLLRLTPWTFSYRHTPTATNTIVSSDDLKQSMTQIRSLAPAQRSMTGDPVMLLVEAAAGIHQVTDEVTLAKLVLDFARRGTGHTHAAYLRPSDADGTIEVIATSPERSEGVYSRSLLKAASNGEMAMLDAQGAAAGSQSIIQMQIQAGLCAPLTLGQTVAGYLYVDSRNAPAVRTPPRAPDFCLALARIASLALANIKRVDIERRQAQLEAQLNQAAAMQRAILPPRAQQFAGLTIVGESRPGQLVGGDFFDVVPLDEHRVAVTIGDVSGKGVAASVLMTTIHGFLHAMLASGAPLDEAVCRLNDFTEPRRPEGKFATLFAAVIDTAARTITYVDAAHGYGMLWDGKAMLPLQNAGGPPMGVFAGQIYTAEAVPFPPGAMLLAVSDGIVEQPIGQSPDGHRHEFDVAGMQACLAECGEGADVVKELFEAVYRHAGTKHLADDATVVLVR